MHEEEAATKPRRTYEGVEAALRAYLRDRGAEEVLNAVVAKHLVRLCARKRQGKYTIALSEARSRNAASAGQRRISDVEGGAQGAEAGD